MTELIFAVVVAHYIADFSLQGEFVATMKGKFDYILFVHSMIWAGCICLVLVFFGSFSWWKAIFLFIGHFIIDRWKARKKDRSNSFTKDLWIDQTLHFIQILCVTLF